MTWEDRQYHAEKQARIDACEHENTHHHVARFTGAPSKCCLDCGAYIMYDDDDDDE